MYTIIPLLLAHIQVLNNQILFLFNFIVKNIPLKPIRHRGNYSVPDDVHCPRCDAPHEYIYDYTGGRGQFCCEICDTHFNRQNFLFNSHIFKCPYCGHSLELWTFYSCYFSCYA